MRTIKVNKPEDVRFHLSNIAALIAEAELKAKGEYRCLIDSCKTKIIVISAEDSRRFREYRKELND